MSLYCFAILSKILSLKISKMQNVSFLFKFKNLTHKRNKKWVRLRNGERVAPPCLVLIFVYSWG